MKTAFAAVCISWLLGAIAHADDARTDFSGTWSGSFEVHFADGRTSRESIWLVLAGTGSRWTGTVGPRAAQQSPIRDVAARGRTLEFESGSAQGKSLRFELRRDGDRLRGTATGEIAEDRVRVEIVAARMSESADASPDALSQTLLALDEAMFDAFNKCADPAELAKHAAFFDKDVEFYHDGSGLTVGVDAVIAQTRQNVCGKFQRKLDRESFRAYPIPGYGAMTVGTHRFCHAPPICEGVADFAMVWRELDGVWKITRTLSYGHRASAAPAKAAASRAQ